MKTVTKRKIKLLYDASLIYRLDGNTQYRNGIFFVALNILLELLKYKDIEITLYCDIERRFGLEDVIKNHSEFKNCKLLSLSKIEKLITNTERRRYFIKQNHRNIFIKAVNKIFLKILYFISRFEKKKYETDFDAYFSARDAAPDFIKNIDRIKKYVVLHDVIPLVYEKKPLKKSWFTDLISTINGNDLYFADSEYTKKDFMKYFPVLKGNKIKVIPLSTGHPYTRITDIEQITGVKKKYGIPGDKKYTFSVCSFEPRKNLIFSVKNFITFIKKYEKDDIYYVLGGGKKDKIIDFIKNEVPDFNLYKEKILFPGYIEDEDMSALYSGAEMFLFPSLYEGFGIPILEAMQCGCPVITSDVTSLPEVIGDAGIRINPTNNEEMVEAIRRLYSDNKFKNECIKKGLERAKLFSWQKCCDIIISEINKGLDNE